MNKSQRNKKEAKQNTRNKISNRHYKSTVKNLLKLFKKKATMQLPTSTIEKEALSIEKKTVSLDKGKLFVNKQTLSVKKENFSLDKEQLFQEGKRFQRAIYSAVDKAVKKGVIHRNSASRKKSAVGLFYGSLSKESLLSSKIFP